MRCYARSSPHTPTLLERALGFLPVPYPVACAILAFLIGPLGQYIALLLDIGSASVAATDTFGLAIRGIPYPTLAGAILGNVSYVLLLFFAPLLIRYGRRTVIDGERDLAPLEPQGEKMYDRVFRGISAQSYPVILSLPFFLLVVYYLYFSLIPQGLNPSYIYLVYVIFSAAFSSLSFATYIWVYATALWGLYEFGKQQLTLKPYYSDRMLGLRPVGTISLALTRSFFLIVLLLMLTIYISPDPLSLALMVTTVALGALFFFLPLKSCHEKLSEAKRKAQGEISDELAALLDSKGNSTTTDVTSGIADMKKLMIVSMAEERARSIPAWPLDTSTLGNFTVILVSVSGALISSVIVAFLGFR